MRVGSSKSADVKTTEEKSRFGTQQPFRRLTVMANTLLKAAGALAIACIVLPPVARVAATAVFIATEAQAQTYGTANLPPEGTGDTGAQIPSNGTMKQGGANGPNAGNTPRSIANSARPASSMSAGGCLPGQTPVIAGMACQPALKDCPPGQSLPGQQAKLLPPSPCTPAQTAAPGAATNVPSELPPSAVQ